MNSKNIELIRQALGAAEASIKLAKQLLSEVESGKEGAVPENQKPLDNTPGIVGIFDGEAMKSDSGETYPVPANYASKSLLVVGDTLKLVEEGKNKEKRFKQIEHVKRQKTSGILAKKEGKWKVVTPEGSYKVLPAAVEHFGAEIGSGVVLQIPAGNLNAPWGALETVKGKETESKEAPAAVEKTPEKEEPKETEPKVVKEAPKVEKREEPKPKPLVKKEEPKVEKVEVKTPPAPKVEEPKKVETPPPPAKVEAPKVEAPKPAPSPAPTPAPTASTPAIEVSPEEDELT